MAGDSGQRALVPLGRGRVGTLAPSRYCPPSRQRHLRRLASGQRSTDTGARGAALRNLAPAVGAFSRQALHAETVQVCHPVSGTPLSISAPYPQDFAHLLTALALREKRDRGGSFKVDSEKNSGYAKT